MIRAFVAIELSAEILRQLAEVGSQLSSLELSGRQTRVASIHLTLKFLGNIESEKVEAIRDRLSGLADRTPPFSLSVERLGVFPHSARPRIVWAGVQPSPALLNLQAGIESGLQELGIDPENRPFHPHLTLFRLKSTRNRDNLVRYLNRHAGASEFGILAVKEFHLFQSRLKPDGAEYTKLVSWSLKGETNE